MSTPHHQTGSFGTFKGIFVPNITMMFGVILFLRLGLVLGNVGLWSFLLIIALSLSVMVVTSFSISMIVTNMNVGNGGVYYLISRSIGIEVGGAIGIALVGAQLISMALCVSGFAYSLNNLFPQFPVVWIELVAMLLLGLLAFLSTDMALKAQLGIFAILMVAIAAIFFSGNPTQSPATPYFSQPLKFWQGFALFYPALTGIEAGMALSGSLKNPSKSLPRGNLTSLIFAALIYSAVAIFLWLHFDRQVLTTDPGVLISSSKISGLIYLGIWSATLSSALGNFLGGPRILQTIAEDNVAPEIFSRSYGKHREPRYAVAFFFIVAITLILTTTIDQILPILTMICLLTYGTLNFVAAIAALISSPSFRPTFRIPARYPLFAAATCLMIMLMVDPGWALASIALICGLYFFLKKRSLNVSFDDIRESIILFFSRIFLYRLSGREQTAKNWLPQILTVSKSTIQHERMIRLADDLTGRSGILTIYTLLPQEQWDDVQQLEGTRQVIRDWLNDKDISGFEEVLSYSNYYESLIHLIKMTGIGPLQPNTVILTMTQFDSAADIAQVVKTGEEYKKNILLFFDDSDSKRTQQDPLGKKKKRIDLWWDPQYKKSFETILSFILALRTSSDWNYRYLVLRTTAQTEETKQHLMNYFRDFLKKIRIKCNLQINIETKPLYESVKDLSSSADLVFFPMQPPEAFDQLDLFHAYIDHLNREFCSAKTPIIAVNGFDEFDHKEIYIPE